MSAPRKVGVVVPSSNVVIERELPRWAPESTSVHFTRAWYRFDISGDPRPLDPLPAMADDTVRAVSILADAGVRAISSGSTAGSFFAGSTYESELIGRMEAQAPGIVATTPASSVVAALESLGVRSVSVVTPYMAPLYEREAEYLEARGFTVAGVSGIGVAHGRDMADLDPAEVDTFVRGHVDPATDACFVSCTNLATADWIDRWESALGKPVVTSNQAMLWMLLGLVGEHETVPGAGRLLAEVERPAAAAPLEAAS